MNLYLAIKSICFYPLNLFLVYFIISLSPMTRDEMESIEVTVLAFNQPINDIFFP